MDVTVPGFQLFEECTVLDAAAADIVGETGKQQAVCTVATIIGAEPRQIFSQYPVCFRMGVLPFSVVLTLLNHMTVGYCWPMFRFMERFIMPYQYTRSLKRRQRHQVCLAGVEK